MSEDHVCLISGSCYYNCVVYSCLLVLFQDRSLGGRASLLSLITLLTFWLLYRQGDILPQAISLYHSETMVREETIFFVKPSACRWLRPESLVPFWSVIQLPA